MKTDSNNASFLSELLAAARQRESARADQYSLSPKVHVAEVGGVVTAAYEQLRNAAEYAEEHLLLQRAIRRFYRRLFLLRDSKQLQESGEELVIELTQAGYIANDTVAEHTVQTISQLGRNYHQAYELLLRRKLSHQQAENWTLDVLAVQVEWQLNDPAVRNSFVQFAHRYFLEHHTLEQLFDTSKLDLDPALYVAIHRALLKSDSALVRASLLDAYNQSPENLAAYQSINQLIDKLLSSDLCEKLYRYIDRKGAPFRVLRHMIDDNDRLETELTHQSSFLSSFEAQVVSDYQSISTRINRGIIKSVIFLIITKFLIGIAVEIPYDYLVFGAIVWLPLLINLAFPPVYMVLLRMTLILPGAANTRRLTDQIEQILYRPPTKQLERKPTVSFGVGYNIAYAFGSLLVFGGVGYLLWTQLGFELMHLCIFFLFLSGASFLGFRLSRMIREVEAVGSDQNAITTVRDFLYMPFVVVGRYMSEKYAQVNIVALSLDMLIELPLKTILRLIRQWGAFISKKQDEL